MRQSNPRRLQPQVQFLRRQFALDGALPFSDVLPEDLVAQTLTAVCVSRIGRIFSPLVTLWVFLSQVLSADHSCRAAVARLLAHRVARGQKPCSARTGAYCQARQRLPEKFFSEVARSVGRALDAKAGDAWLWKGRRVYLFDGTTVSMPDTPANQEAYPQVYNQKPGEGFPLARVGALTPLACGALLHLGVCRYAGKGQGEISLLRTLWDLLRPRDILLTDRLQANWLNILPLQERGIDFVSRLNKANRTPDFRRGKRLGPRDHLVRWRKPTSIRSLGRRAYQALPESITIRETEIRVTQPGFRTKAIVVVTTLLDPQQAKKDDLAALYRERWHNELGLRAIKSTMQMHDLRCKTPDVLPRSVSFKGAMQTPEAFQPMLELLAADDRAPGLRLYQHLLAAIATHRVADRPDRFEPRAKKRRRNHYAWLTRPRGEVKRKMPKGVTVI